MDVQNPRFGRYIQALFGLKQRLTLGQALPDAQPIINLESPRPEMETYTDNDLFHGALQVPAVAAEYAFFAASMPVTAGRLAVIEKITLGSSSNMIYALAAGGGTPPGAAAGEYGQPRDSRRSGQRSALKFYTGSNAATIYFTNAAGRLRVPANQNGGFSQSQVLVPQPNLGTLGAPLIIVQANTLTTAFDIAIEWRERPLTAQEASPL